MKPGRLQSAVLVVAIAAAVTGAALAAAERRPLWRYHNGNTLHASPKQYQLGYAIGVMDGYLAAHERARESGETPAWLDLCLSDGLTAPSLSAELTAHLGRAFRDFDRPAADILLDYMQRRCVREPPPSAAQG